MSTASRRKYGLSSDWSLALLAVVLVAAALFASDGISPQRAEAFCDGVGNPMGFGYYWGQEEADVSTCNLDDIYAGTIYDLTQDGSCVYYGYEDPTAVYYHASDCTHSPATSGTHFAYYDDDSYHITYLWRWYYGSRQVKTQQNFGY